MSVPFCFKPAVPAALVVLISGCAAPVSGPVAFHDTTPRLAQTQVETRASFECGGALPAVHRQICASEMLSAQDKQLADQYRTLVQNLDTAGGLLLEANQRQWMLSRAAQCGMDNQTGTDVQADAAAVACLQASYRDRAQRLATWALSSRPLAQQQAAHPYSAYVDYRLADGREPGLCSQLADQLNDDLQRNGLPNPARLPGTTVLAGSNSATSVASLDGREIRVDLYNAGPYAGYQNRARGLLINGQVVMDDRTLPRWVAELPNYGGRAYVSSSQTSDYGSIDVFRRAGRSLVLVNETWGFYSPAARGESAFSGLYELSAQGLQPLCLFQTYLTPPRTNTLAGMPAYAALEAELNKIAGDPLPGYAQHERRDNFQRWKERQWTLLNLPLLGADALSRYGREAAVYQRNDQALEALFNWSERNLGSKTGYRKVMPMLRPAHQELVQMFLAQGLDAAQSQAAADLLFHETLARSMENLAPPVEAPDLPLTPQDSYPARYAIAPAAGALEQGRHFATLYSVLLNDAPANVINDFVNYETDTFGARRGLGPDQSPALMAAVASPASLELLLQRGFDPDAANAWGKTPLMSAAELNLLPAARRLIDAGANVHAQTRQVAFAGVGGPDRQEAEAGRSTALLIAARQAEAPLIDLLINAGAAAQAWDGYHQQVCVALDVNGRLSDAERSRVKGPLCTSVYTAPPPSQQTVADIRAGDTLILRDTGVDYRIRLLERPAMVLFGRNMQLTPERLRNDMGSIARQVGMAAVRRGKMKIAGPLTLAIQDMSAMTDTQLPMLVSFPVNALGGANVANYVLERTPQQQVLSVNFDPQQADVESTWRALFSAALTQGFTPSQQGYVVMHTQGVRRTEYQLVVSE
ncbi:lysozyme inhibitor LprI family protein [Halopseudomonas pelagia]|uniref:lysozyme inhibitor LprI family protein n=1 Tax=Halopseudomonas pelagia TaxID=553151 RepID=UPI0003A78E4E|nr:lysozyme inhibitor LprI family protein [Halopseudomonas pelagia]